MRPKPDVRFIGGVGLGTTLALLVVLLTLRVALSQEEVTTTAVPSTARVTDLNGNVVREGDVIAQLSRNSDGFCVLPAGGIGVEVVSGSSSDADVTVRVDSSCRVTVRSITYVTPGSADPDPPPQGNRLAPAPE